MRARREPQCVHAGMCMSDERRGERAQGRRAKQHDVEESGPNQTDAGEENAPAAGRPDKRES